MPRQLIIIESPWEGWSFHIYTEKVTLEPYLSTIMPMFILRYTERLILKSWEFLKNFLPNRMGCRQQKYIPNRRKYVLKFLQITWNRDLSKAIPVSGRKHFLPLRFCPCIFRIIPVNSQFNLLPLELGLKDHHGITSVWANKRNLSIYRTKRKKY